MSKESHLNGSSIRVLVVDDFERWRHFVRLTLQVRPEWEVIGEAWDGAGAVQKVRDLQPDLIVLDVGLPVLNGIEAARRIHELSPGSRILFLSENRSWEIVQVALSTGAGGYVLKSDAAHDLIPAAEAVLRGERFLSAKLAGPNVTDRPNPVLRHEVTFYTDDRPFFDHLTQFIGSALKLGNGAIVAATEPHRTKLLPRLRMDGVDVGASIQEGRFLAVDAADALSTFMRGSRLDPALVLKAFGDLIAAVVKGTKAKRPRVAIFGECVHLLWEQGNAEAAIQMEKLGNELIRMYDVDILCGYCLGSADFGMDSEVYRRICAQHSAVYSR